MGKIKKERNIGSAKKFIQVFLCGGMEKPEGTFIQSNIYWALSICLSGTMKVLRIKWCILHISLSFCNLWPQLFSFSNPFPSSDLTGARASFLSAFLSALLQQSGVLQQAIKCMVYGFNNVKGNFQLIPWTVGTLRIQGQTKAAPEEEQRTGNYLVIWVMWKAKQIT